MTPEARDEWARKQGFLVLVDGEAYEKRLTESGSLFVFSTDPINKLWIVEYHVGYRDHKENWHEYSTVKAGNVKWEKALAEAESYIRWFVSKGGKRGAKRK